MKFLIYGSKGWIGQQVLEEMKKRDLHYIEGVKRAINQEELKKEITDITPTHIISFIGRTHGKINDVFYKNTDYLEDHSKLSENVRDNLYSPIVLAILCEKLNIHFTYVGTGCLYEYDEEHPFANEATGFKESDSPNFFNSHYSSVKGYTDQLMHLFENTLNLRLRMCLSETPHWRNFLTKFINYDKICSVPNSISVLSDLIPILVDMTMNKITGTINFTNPGLVSHNEILEMYKELVDPSFTWKNMTREEQKTLLVGSRSNCLLDTTKLKQLFPNVKNVKDALKDCMLKYKTNILNTQI